jgi:glycosyltransferase involved in cell wall biosynthesis
MRVALVNLSTGDISGGYAEYLNQFLTRAGKDNCVSKILFVSIPQVAQKIHLPAKCQHISISRWDVLLPRKKKIIKAIHEFQPDIVFSPVEKRLPSIKDIPLVTMIQNMEPLTTLTSGNTLAWNLRLLLLRRASISAAKSADHVIALSSFVKAFLVNKLDLVEKNISSIPHGFDIMGYLEPIKPPGIIEGQQFIFTAGSVLPARGLEDLISAYIELMQKNSIVNKKIYIAGKVIPQHKRWYLNLIKKIRAAGLEQNIIWLGELSKSEMAWCYQNTALFVMTSRVESFGIIALESMALGCPVISSTSPCLPEIYKDYAEYYKPYDHMDLAGKIKQHLDSPAIKPPLSLEKYSWDIIFDTTLELFQRLTTESTFTK